MTQMTILQMCTCTTVCTVAGLEISARPLTNASGKPVGRVEIAGYSPGLPSRIFIFGKTKL